MINNKKITYFLKKYSYDTFKINRLIISAFCRVNKIVVKENLLLKKHLIPVDNSEEELILLEFINEVKTNYKVFVFEDVINLFEFVISPKDKEINGAIYTPKYIRDFIINQTIVNNISKDITICDIACGCGSFLIDSSIEIHKRGISFYEIFKNNIYGVDIAQYSVQRTELLLSLLAIINGEDKEGFKFNIFIGNSLEFDWFEKCSNIKKSQGFDYVLGNPPYVSSENIDNDSKKLAQKWKTSSVGKLDLYIPFFEIALKWIKEDGVLGYITVNSFYRSLNGRNLRNFFSKNEFLFKLIDFGHEQVFKNRTTYTCICIIRKITGFIEYTNTLSKNINNLTNKDFIRINYNILDDYNGWLLDEYDARLNIQKLENSGIKLEDYVNIKNGFATLRNNIYIIQPHKEDNKYFYFSKIDKEFKVEKSICRKAIKPNILKNESDIEEKMEYLIFPYMIDNKKISIISEENFKNNFNKAYTYLSFFKEELSKRDNGNKKYEKWYAFGRNQALTINGDKLLFPYISNSPYFVYTDIKDLLFYNGYAIIDEDKEKLLLLKVILTSDIFWYYVKTKSKPYSSGYYSMAKNYIRLFTIPYFSIEEKKKLLGYKRKSLINKLLAEKYGNLNL